MNLSRNLLAVAVIAGVLTIAFVLGLVLPGNRRLRDKREQIRTEQTLVQAEQAEAARMAPLYEEVREIADRLRGFHAAIPEQHEFAETFRRLSEIMQELDLPEHTIQPGRAQPIAADRQSKDVLLSRNVVVQPVLIEVAGPTDAVFGLLAAIEDMKRLTEIEQLRIWRETDQPPEGSAGDGGRAFPRVPGHRVRCELTLNTFFLPRARDEAKPDNARPAMAAATGP